MLRTTYGDRLDRIWQRLLDIDPLVAPDLEDWRQKMGLLLERLEYKMHKEYTRIEREYHDQVADWVARNKV